MIQGSCHCGAVRFDYQRTAETAASCNCSICRRLGATWIYANADQITFHMAEGATRRYLRGEENIGFHSCTTCGCPTHWENMAEPETGPMAVNLNLCDPEEAAKVPVRRFDGADSWSFID